MRLHLITVLLLAILVSCTEQNLFPEKKSNRIPLDELQIETIFTNVHNDETLINSEIIALKNNVEQYTNKDVNFNLNKFEEQWESVSVRNNYNEWSTADSIAWIKSTGLLLELTADAKYAEMLEFISIDTLNQNLAPFILTKRLDHIYVNLFKPIEINYAHTLGGDVHFRQETDYPKSGSVKLHFGMTQRRYMELFIRIPSWAQGTTVTVKQVKYFAAPGTYCKIAKKWKEGDLVEIKFPMDNFPQ